MMIRRVAVRGIIIKDDKILAQKLTTGDDGIERDYWCTPGGGLDINESLHDGLIREMIEETGIHPKIGKLLFVQQFSEDGIKEQMEFFFHIENHDDYENIDLTQTTHGEAEIKEVCFIDPTKNNILPDFLQSINISDHITNNIPVTINDYLKK